MRNTRDRWENRRHHWENRRRHCNENRTGTVLAGLFLLLVGIVAILRQTIFDFPSWVLSWPMILIAVGIFIGLKNGFRGPGWVILIGLGCIFLADKIVPGADLKPFIWPFIIIALGLFMIFGAGSRRRWMRQRWGVDEVDKREIDSPAEDNFSNAAFEAKDDNDDFVESTAILGSSKKVILSKNFKGGDITSFMGGTEINCSQAEITGRVKLDITQIFGGTKLIVPAHWTIKSTVTSIFGGFEDKRSPSGVNPDPDKVLVLDGTTIFGGIEIKSY